MLRACVCVCVRACVRACWACAILASTHGRHASSSLFPPPIVPQGDKQYFPDSWQNYNSSTALHAIEDLIVDNLAIVISAVVFVVLSEIQGVVCAFLNLTAHVVVRNFEMVTNCLFLALGITALCVSVPTHQLLSRSIFLTSLLTSVALLVTGCIGVLAACQRREGMFKFYGVVGVINCLSLITGGVLLLIYGGAVSESTYVSVSEFCTATYVAAPQV